MGSCHKSLWCVYHRDHGHEIDMCLSIKFLVEKLIMDGHFRRYVKEVDHKDELGQVTDGITVVVPTKQALKSYHS